MVKPVAQKGGIPLDGIYLECFNLDSCIKKGAGISDLNVSFPLFGPLVSPIKVMAKQSAQF